METASTTELHLSAADQLNTLLKPYRSEWKRQEKLSKFMEQCIRAAKKEDFFQIAELLSSRTATALKNEGTLGSIAAPLTTLKSWSETQISAYRAQLITDLTAAAQEANLPLSIDFPRFTSRKGINGTIEFASRKTTINGKALKSVDPDRILSQVKKLDRRLYGRSFDAQAFIDGLHRTWSQMGGVSGKTTPIQEFYFQHVLSMQSRSFRQNMDKSRFKGYPLDEFSVDLWRFFSSSISKTTSGHTLQIRPGRGQNLWLLDQTGEPRQITSIAFGKGA